MTGTADSRLDTVWHAAQEQFGGTSFETARGEFNTALLVDSDPDLTGAAYVVKVPHGESSLDRQRLMYEARVVERIGASPLEAPVQVPRLLGKSENLEEPAWAAFSYVPGQVLSHRYIRERFSNQEQLVFGRKVGETILWFSKVIDLETYYQELDPPPPVDRESHFRKTSRAALSLDGADYPDLIRWTKAEAADYEWFRSRGILRPRIIGHDDIRPGNIAFKHIDGGWHFTGLFDFGMTAPSTPEREARHVRLLGGYASHQVLGAFYGVRNPEIDGPLIPGTDDFAETVTNFWAYSQVLTNGMYRIKHGVSVGSVPLKFDGMLAGMYDLAELDTIPDMSQIDLRADADSGL